MMRFHAIRQLDKSRIFLRGLIPRRKDCSGPIHPCSPAESGTGYSGKVRDKISLIRRFSAGALFIFLLTGLAHVSVVNAQEQNNASCFGISAPVRVFTSQRFTASMGFINTGTKTWTNDATPHRAGSQNPQDNTRWGSARVSLPQDVLPGVSVVFSGEFVAPSFAGTYPFDWQMVEESAEWFGEICRATIVVEQAPASVGGAPLATTFSAASVSQTSAFLQGTVNPNSASTNAWFEYGTTASLGGLVGQQTVGSGASAITYSFTVSILQPGTTYYFRAVAQNGFGTSQGSVLTFTTLQSQSFGAAPFIATRSAVNIGAGQALFQGSVNQNSLQTNVWFEYGTSPSFGGTIGQQSVGSGAATIDFSFTIFGLQQGATYYYRAVAQNSSGISYGNTIIFTTTGSGTGSSVAPVVATNSASAVSQTSALLQGTVNPNSASTNAWFEYGTTASLGGLVGQQTVGSGASLITYSFVLSGLQSGITYYYRAVAQNGFGTNYGTIVSFTTTGVSASAGAPFVLTSSASSVGAGSATLVGVVNPNGSLTNTWFEYGISSSLGSIIAVQPAGSGTWQQQFFFSLAGLQPNTLYYYRAVAQSSYGTSYGSLMSFTTQAGTGVMIGGLPQVTTRPSSFVFQNSALLNGNINPNSLSTYAWFEWGGTSSLGNTTTKQLLGNVNVGLDYSFALTGLQPGTLYYYRAVAQNSQGTQFGALASFVTTRPSFSSVPASPVPPSSPPPIAILPPSAPSTLASSLAAVILSADVNSPSPGDTVNLTIVYKNGNTFPLKDAVVKIDFPAEVAYENASIIPSVQSLSRVEFMAGNLGAQSQSAMTVRIKVGDSVPASSVLMFTATLAYRDPSETPQSVNAFLALPVKEKPNETGALASVASALGESGWTAAAFPSVLLAVLSFFHVRIRAREKKIREELTRVSPRGTSGI
ncbi:MAG: Uncharacterized protein G01um101429_904 [Parcubacteria group bacterium Gr01-1014_29]|nr:MAG: Uncharacterized protein G01um101429_904 [Parcubacteria group bacterium Gr01-1014_29]